MSYSKFNEEFANAKTRKAKQTLLESVSKGDFGAQVKSSIFGLGDFDPNHDLTRERLAEIKNAQFGDH
jgi:hypothetical protein